MTATAESQSPNSSSDLSKASFDSMTGAAKAASLNTSAGISARVIVEKARIEEQLAQLTEGGGMPSVEEVKQIQALSNQLVQLERHGVNYVRHGENLVEHGPKWLEVDRLLDVASSAPYESARIEAIQRLRDFCIPEVEDFLISMTAEDYPFDIRKAAVGALAGHDSDRASGHLLELLEGRHNRLGYHAYTALRAHTGDELNRNLLLTALGTGDQDQAVRCLLVFANGKADNKIEGLTKLTKHGNESVRQHALEALYRLDRNVARPLMIEALNDWSRNVSLKVANLLSGDDHPDTNAAFRRVLSDWSSYAMRNCAFRRLQNDMSGSTTKTLIDCLADEPSKSLHAAIEQALLARTDHPGVLAALYVRFAPGFYLRQLGSAIKGIFS